MKESRTPETGRISIITPRLTPAAFLFIERGKALIYIKREAGIFSYLPYRYSAPLPNE